MSTALQLDASNNATPSLMGKQTEGHAQKALDSPCSNLYQASLKCECWSWNRQGSSSCWCVSLAQARMLHTKFEATFAGLEQNKYIPDKCQDAFTAYKDCKKQEVMLRTQLVSTPCLSVTVCAHAIIFADIHKARASRGG